MSKTLIIYAHPNPQSFNHAIAETAERILREAGNDVRTRDLYALKFNPVLSGDDFTSYKNGGLPDVREEHEHILWADQLLFTYPIWWFGRPAILQGYIDRVFNRGFAFDIKDGAPVGLLKHKRALVFQTTGQAVDAYKPTGLDDAIHKPMIEGTLQFCGIKDARIKTFYAVPAVNDGTRQEMLGEVEKAVREFA
ncbi:MAG: NAD(P)H-dependent oxidoreductase [Bdellovibrionales bacterium]